MFDPNFKATGPLVAVPEVAAKEVPAFVAEVRAALAAAPAVTLAANSVQVTPGGKTFTTITDALNSIIDAKKSKQYLVQVGPGTYDEVIVCKPWVFIAGSGTDQTTVTAPASKDQWDKGTVRACSNAAVQNMTIISIGHNWGDWTCAVNADAAQNFDVENCNLQAIDQTGNNGSNLVALAVDYSAGGGGSQLNVAYCGIVANGGGQPIGVGAFGHSYVELTDSKILAENANTSWGAAAAAESALYLYNCFVQGSQSLVLNDGTGKITARDCQLVGPYSPGVVIVND
jgi:pectin methylesterase-like acyl-CoA thioesterase